MRSIQKCVPRVLLMGKLNCEKSSGIVDRLYSSILMAFPRLKINRLQGDWFRTNEKSLFGMTSDTNSTIFSKVKTENIENDSYGQNDTSNNFKKADLSGETQNTKEGKIEQANNGDNDLINEDKFGKSELLKSTFSKEYSENISKLNKDLNLEADIVVVVGGDGTLLRAASLFSKSWSPLIIPIAAGTLGFMMPYKEDRGVDILRYVISNWESSHEVFPILEYMRLSCSLVTLPTKDGATFIKTQPYFSTNENYTTDFGSPNTSIKDASSDLHVNHYDIESPESSLQPEMPFNFNNNSCKNIVDDFKTSITEISQSIGCVFGNRTNHDQETANDQVALNEITFHRGHGMHPISLVCNINGASISLGQSDGLIVSTPSGSTAYSLSAGGPLINPKSESISLVSICPRSLASRPLVMPASSKMLVSGAQGTNPVYYSVDGSASRKLEGGKAILIGRHRYPLRIFSRKDEDSAWIQSLTAMLGWNRLFSRPPS